MEAAADANNTAKSAFSRLMRVTVSPQLATREEVKELSTNLILLKCADTFQLFLTPENCTGHFDILSVFRKLFKQRKTLRTKVVDSRSTYLVSNTISPKTLRFTRKSYKMDRAYQGYHATRTFPKLFPLHSTNRLI